LAADSVEHLLQTVWFYGERLQSNGELNFVQFFSGTLCTFDGGAGPFWLAKKITSKTENLPIMIGCRTKC